MKPKPKKDTAAAVVKAAMAWHEAVTIRWSKYAKACAALEKACKRHTKARKP